MIELNSSLYKYSLVVQTTIPHVVMKEQGIVIWAGIRRFGRGEMGDLTGL